MNLPDLKQIYKVINWHENDRDEKGKHVGLFILLPSDIAEQFPEEGKEGEDNSPSHITLLYVGEYPLTMEDRLKEIVCESCSMIKPFKVRLQNPKKFNNDEGQIVRHSPISSKKLKQFHQFLRKIFFKYHIPFSDKHPEYKPHVTIEYINKGEKAKFKKIKPKGFFVVDHIWLWGTNEPYLIPLGKK